MSLEEKQLSNSVYHATKWSAITNVIGKLLIPITNMILARLLAPDAFGVVATINMLISFADVFSDAGFQKYLIQHEFSDTPSLFRCADVSFWTNLCVSVVLLGGIIYFRDPLAALVGSAGYGAPLAVAGVSIPIASFSSIQQAIYQRNFDFKGLFFPRIVKTLLPLAITIPLAFTLRNCWALIAGNLASNLSDAVILTLHSQWKPHFYYSFTELRKMFSFSAWTLIESFSIWLTIYVDVFLIGRLMSSHYLGLYKTSLTTVSQIMNPISATMIPVLFSALSRCQSDRKLFANTLYSFQRTSAIVLVPLGVGIFLYSDIVTGILLGPQWVEAEKFIGAVGLMRVWTILYANFASEVYRSMGEPKISFLVQISYILMITPCILWGARQGFEALCRVKIFLMFIFILMHMLVLKFRYKLEWVVMFRNAAVPTVASGIMFAGGYFMRLKAQTMGLTVASILACVLIYFAVCFLFPKTRKVILSVFKRLSKRA